jgi:hypothetical protein
MTPATITHDRGGRLLDWAQANCERVSGRLYRERIEEKLQRLCDA